MDTPRKAVAVDSQIKEYFKRWPRLYYFIYVFFGPLYFGGFGPKDFLKRYPTDNGLCVNLGSGPRVIAEYVVNVDMMAYPNVQIVADLTSLPFASGSVARAISAETLEHVADTDAVLRELHRILEKGGYAYISVPFLYPFHAAPFDFYRWTHHGFLSLMHEFEVVESGVRSGPFSVLTTLCCYMTASLLCFRSERIYWLLIYVSMFVFFPLKFLDIIANRMPFARNTAALVYCVVRKRVE